jgi:alpha-N-arabinofuranosidase
MANTVNLVNSNALMSVRDRGVLVGATYHVWDLYQNHLGPLALPATVSGPARFGEIRQGAPEGVDTFESKAGTVPYLDAIATSDSARTSLQVAAINRHPTDAIEADLVRADGRALPRLARAHRLGAETDDLYATNTFDQPDRVMLRDLGDVPVAGSHVFAAHSVTVLEFPM